MARYVIWSQVALALIGLIAALADRGRVPSSLFPPQAVLTLCAYSALIAPVVVIRMGRRRKPDSGQRIEAVASVGLSLATVFALLPLVQ